MMVSMKMIMMIMMIMMVIMIKTMCVVQSMAWS